MSFVTQVKTDLSLLCPRPALAIVRLNYVISIGTLSKASLFLFHLDRKSQVAQWRVRAPVDELAALPLADPEPGRGPFERTLQSFVSCFCLCCVLHEFVNCFRDMAQLSASKLYRAIGRSLRVLSGKTTVQGPGRLLLKGGNIPGHAHTPQSRLALH